MALIGVRTGVEQQYLDKLFYIPRALYTPRRIDHKSVGVPVTLGLLDEMAHYGG